MEKVAEIPPPVKFDAHNSGGANRLSRSVSMAQRAKRRHWSCWQQARIQAKRRHRGSDSKFLLWLLTLAEFLFQPTITRPMPVARRLAMSAMSDPEFSRPPNEYERGDDFKTRSASPKVERYRSRPTLQKLMKDLRRPAARSDARAALEKRIPDPITRNWALAHIDGDELNRLSIYIRPGISEADTMSAWYSEAHPIPDVDDSGGSPPPPENHRPKL
jgi:hypothetical protein